MTLSVFQWASAQVCARPLNGGLQEGTEADVGGLHGMSRPARAQPPRARTSPRWLRKVHKHFCNSCLTSIQMQEPNVEWIIKKIDQPTVSPSYKLGKVLFIINSSRRQVRARQGEEEFWYFPGGGGVIRKQEELQDEPAVWHRFCRWRLRSEDTPSFL